MLTEHTTRIRVRYQETDSMGILHHAHYLTYFEIGRTEMLRASGGNYRRMEEEGFYIVVVKAECRYKRPAYYDDLLNLHTCVARITSAKIEHEYHLMRDGELLAVGKVALACVDREGSVRRVPQWMQAEEPPG
ncbi:MAG: acyl-CoA thioesterase [Planctomycetes bacterium]|nr:acyl-CoA thioesterase [Planctomycetota bacterium]